MNKETKETICFSIYVFSIIAFFVTISFFIGYTCGQANMVQIGFEILDHSHIDEVNFDINETEITNTMIDRFEDDYGFNLTKGIVNDDR